jgi:hypothetical protein
MASKTQQRLLERKAAKQKKLLLVLTPVFLGLLVWQGPGIFGALTGGGAETAPAPPPPPPAAATPASPPPATPGVQPPPPGEEGTGLPDTDPPPAAEDGQLVGFSRFIGKDPFKQQLVGTPTGGTPPPSATSPSQGATPPTPPPPAASSPVASPPPPPPAASGSSPSTAPRATSARIEVNGSAETVRVRATFPAGDPVFRLASIGAGTVRIGLVAGAFEGGAKTVEVRVGESVVLVSKPDGLRYRIRVLSVGA